MNARGGTGRDGPRREPRARRRVGADSARVDGAGTVLYGRNAVREALRGPRRVRRVWATPTAASAPWLREPEAAGAGAASPPLTDASAEAIEARCGSAAHQGVCAEVDPYRYADADGLLRGARGGGAPEPLIIALDEIQDPQNLGAICRTAEAAGASGVVLPERRSAEVTPAVCKASAGAVEHLAVARVRNIADFLSQAKAAGCWCYGAAAGAPQPYDAVDYRGGVVLVLGSEGRGLRPRVAKACDALVALPLRGRVASLNVSAAAAVLIYEVLRRRGEA